ncbi:MAG: LCP family protein [Lachnospiraceae bacterium]|nr:LCP family protein [Lachnospiraceae bacterium]
MANNGNQSTVKNTSKRGKQKKRNRIIIFTVEIVVIAVLLGALWILKDFGNATTQPNQEGEQAEVKGPTILDVDFDQDNLAINDQILEKPEIMEGYWNIALFGVDSRSGELVKGTLSDSIMIASVNLATGDIKLVSVYRDTYLNLGNDKYGKCNSAYSYGGAEQAIKMLNMNLDMNITEFVTVGFEGLTATIDALGGVWLDVDEEELEHINNYQKTMAEDMQISYIPVEETGYQLLNGLQATAYCRIRYKTGNDFARAAAQREVLQAISDEAKKADLATLTRVVNDVSPYVYTSFSMDEILELTKDIAKYNLVDNTGFPHSDMRGTATLGSKGSCVYAVDLEDNVKWLHEYLFGEVDYEPSDAVKEYSGIIHDFVGQYVDF